mmetsp:Transcript_14120/g.42703  ORF Transcript_14120/g.42703 Transcript_14120/m.42703 type:complete len:239 (-) Transcript_14120:1020-1736(-)
MRRSFCEKMALAKKTTSSNSLANCVRLRPAMAQSARPPSVRWPSGKSWSAATVAETRPATKRGWHCKATSAASKTVRCATSGCETATTSDARNDDRTAAAGSRGIRVIGAPPTAVVVVVAAATVELEEEATAAAVGVTTSRGKRVAPTSMKTREATRPARGPTRAVSKTSERVLGKDLMALCDPRSPVLREGVGPGSDQSMPRCLAAMKWAASCMTLTAATPSAIGSSASKMTDSWPL